MSINLFLSIVVVVCLFYGAFRFIHFMFFYTAEKALKKRSECCSSGVYSSGDLDYRCIDCGKRCNFKKEENEFKG